MKEKEEEILEKVMETAKELANEWSGGWFNYRIIEKENKWTGVDNKEYTDIFYEIHEVYYNGKGEIIAWTDEPMTIWFEDKYDIKYTINHIKKATKHTILKMVTKENGDEDLVDTGKYIKNIKR